MSKAGLAVGLPGGALTAIDLTGAFKEAIDQTVLIPEIMTGFGIGGAVISVLGGLYIAVDTYTDNGRKGIPINDDLELGYTPDTGFWGTTMRSWAVLGLPGLGYSLIN